MPRGRGAHNRARGITPDVATLLARMNLHGFDALEEADQDELVGWFEENDRKADRDKVARYGDVLDGTARMMEIARSL